MSLLHPRLEAAEDSLRVTKQKLRDAYAVVQKDCDHGAILHVNTHQVCTDGQFFPAERVCLQCRAYGTDRWFIVGMDSPRQRATDKDPHGLFTKEFVKVVGELGRERMKT